MTNNIAKIRAALESIRTCDDMLGERDAALAALAELEKAAAEPAACVLVPKSTLEHILEYWNGNQNERAMADALEHILDTVQDVIAAAPPAPVAEIREAVDVTRPMCHGAWALFWSEPNTGDSCDQARRWLEAWRSELGPTLGLVELKEPTPEECERIENQFTLMTMRLDTSGGRDLFDACRAVMWPKEGL